MTAGVLLSAASAGDLEVVELLIKRADVDLDARNAKGATALHLASFAGHPRVAKALVDGGADVNAADNVGQTVLQYASASAATGGVSVVELLLDRGASMTATDARGGTALHYAASRGSCPVVDLLLRRGAGMETKTEIGDTPLAIAALSGRLGAVRLLLRQGADVHCTANDGHTALFRAAFNGHRGVAQVLLDNGVDVNATTTAGASALMVAATRNHVEVVHLLLDRGAAVDLRDATFGYTALHFAATTGNREVAQVLVERGACTTAESAQRRTPRAVMKPKSEEDRRAFERMLRPENAKLIREAHERCRARGEAAMQEVRQECYLLATRRLTKAQWDLREAQERLVEALMRPEEVQDSAAERVEGSRADPAGAPRVKEENGGAPSKRARV